MSNKKRIRKLQTKLALASQKLEIIEIIMFSDAISEVATKAAKSLSGLAAAMSYSIEVMRSTTTKVQRFQLGVIGDLVSFENKKRQGVMAMVDIGNGKSKTVYSHSEDFKRKINFSVDQGEAGGDSTGHPTRN